MFLVAGLGNPGPEYVRTPHNAGFLAVDLLAERNGVKITRPEKSALVGPGSISGKPVLLAKPQTYMNRSGASVKGLLEKYEIPLDRLIVVWDELNLSWGAVKILGKGSAGGHNGAQSVINSIGSLEFTRVRIGVNPGHPLSSGADYLLSPMRRQMEEQLAPALETAALAVEAIIAEGVEKAMTKINRRAQGVQEDE